MSKVEWSDEARKNFRNTIRYIAYEFGKKAVRKFEANIAQWENLIAMNPAMGHPPRATRPSRQLEII